MSRSKVLLGIAILGFTLACLGLFLTLGSMDKPTPYEAAGTLLKSAMSGDAEAIDKSVGDRDLQNCQLTRDQWRQIVRIFVRPAFAHWHLNNLAANLPSADGTAFMSNYNVKDTEGRMGVVGITMYMAGRDTPLSTTVAMWVNTAAYLEGMNHTDPKQPKKPSVIYAKTGFETHWDELKEAGFKGYSSFDGHFVPMTHAP